MTIVFTIIIAIILLAIGGVYFAQWRGKQLAISRINNLTCIGAETKAAAIVYITYCADQVSLWSVLRDHLVAPFVLLIPLLRLPREANDLPDTLAYWRNDVGINGDGFGGIDETGKYIDFSGGKHVPPGIKAYRYSDPNYPVTGQAYYAPGHHPRSWYARYKWLAFRNVATLRMYEEGPLITDRPILLAGEDVDSGAYQKLFWNGLYGEHAAFCWHSQEKWGPLALWTQVGAKLGVAYTYPEVMPCRAMISGAWRAIKIWSA